MKITFSRLWIYYQLPALLWMLFIFIASSLPGNSIPELGFQYEDKWEHLVVYALLGFLLCRAFYHQQRFGFLQRQFALWTFLVGSLYGFSDEWHQMYVPGRTATITDAIADVVGVVLGIGLFLVYQKLRRRRE